MNDFEIRPFRASDCGASGQVYFDAVRHGTGEYYSKAERLAWAPSLPEPESWLARLSSQITFVAARDGNILGFISGTAEGYIDLIFVAPEAIKHGVGKALYDRYLDDARIAGATHLSAEVSLVARSFFENRGWRVVTAQTVTRGGIALNRFAMELELT